MTVSRLVAAVLGLACGIACAGNVKTVVLKPDPTVLKPDPTDSTWVAKGVLFYMPAYVKVTYAFTVFVDGNGKVVGRADNNTCEPVIQREEVSLMADVSRPALVQNSPGWLSAAKFSVSLTNGLLTSVNSEPTQKLSDLLTAAAAVTTAVAAVRTAGVAAGDSGITPACNASPAIQHFRKITLE